MSRTITEILKEADSTNELQGLINLWNEIANNKKQYPLTQIWFANEIKEGMVHGKFKDNSFIVVVKNFDTGEDEDVIVHESECVSD